MGETFITFEINVDKHAINRQTIDNALRTSIEQGYGQFDLKGYSLVSEGKIDYLESFFMHRNQASNYLVI